MGAARLSVPSPVFLAGGLMHAAFAAAGLSAVLRTSATAYTLVKTAGAIYLVALGLRTLWASWRHQPASRGFDVSCETKPHRATMSLRQAFVLGFLSDATNPKVAIFFLTFLPQFVVPGGGAAGEIVFLGILFNVIATSWWIGYVFVLDRLGAWLRSAPIRRIVETATGAVLIGLGLRVGLER